ncbi:MAG: hypothetical protein Q4F95_14515 [Oscillospiraceae bacterium]|nr:hypothetical protein [Oscillospiraceae bacterium]
MEYDIFLYGRTRTRDYYDMYIPKWLTPQSDGYKDYRKIISHIFKIRDSIPEKSSGILKKTADSFYFYIFDDFCILCRCCYIASEDEYGRSICSTEGFICRKCDLKSFWLMIPDMILTMLNMSKTYYQSYMDGVTGSGKLPSINCYENIEQTVNILSSDPVSAKAENLMTDCSIKIQLMGLIHAMCERIVPFTFVVGSQDKKLYSYSSQYSVPEMSMFFTFDEMTSVTEFNTWKSDYKPFRSSYAVENEHDSRIRIYLVLSRIGSGRFHYRLAAGSSSDDNTVKPEYLSYEGEFERSVNISCLKDMYRAVRGYLEARDWTVSDTSKYIFEKKR